VAWGDVVAYAPEVLILMPCSLELERVASEFELVRRLPDWVKLPAVQAGRVYAGHTHLFSRSGPRSGPNARGLRSSTLEVTG
jgi:iron complex transport system substrate-binding protein